MLFISTAKAKSVLLVRLEVEELWNRNVFKIHCSCQFWVEIRLKFTHDLKHTSFNIYIVISTISQGKVWIHQHVQTLSKWGLKRWLCVFVQQGDSHYDGGGVSGWEWNSPVCVIMVRVISWGCNIHCTDPC